MTPTPRRRHKPSGDTLPLDREIYRLEIVCEATDGIACLHAPASMSLAALHEKILEELGVYMEVPYKFEIPARQGDAVVVGPGAADPGTLLGGFGFEPGAGFLYTPELPRGPLAVRIEVTEVYEAAPDATFPDVEFWDLTAHKRPLPTLEDAQGDAAPMIPLDADLEPLERMILEAFEEHHFELDEDVPHTDFDGQLALARRMLELVEPRPLQFEALCDAVSEELDEWVWSLVTELLERRRFQEYLDLLDRMDRLPEVFPEQRSSRILACSHMNQRDEALAIFDGMLTDLETDPDMEFHVASALMPLVELGALEEAEAAAHRLRGSRDVEVRFDVFDALTEIYKKTGRKREARRAEQEAAKAAEEILREDPDRWGSGEDDGAPDQEAPVVVTVRREGPKVGRNDPCPCGSGKKYKKCCGA